MSDEVTTVPATQENKATKELQQDKRAVNTTHGAPGGKNERLPHIKQAS